MSTRIQSMMKQITDGNALLVSSAANIYYLTCQSNGESGFGDPQNHERDAWMLITHSHAYLFTDSRYESAQLAKYMSRIGVKVLIIRHDKKLSTYLLEISQEQQINRIDFETQDLSVAEYTQLKAKGVNLGDSLHSLGQDAGKYAISRAVKHDTEAQLIKDACMLVDDLLTQVISQIKIGMSEQDILKFFYNPEIELAFPPIVAIDENSAIPHYDPKAHGEKLVKNGSLILLDCGVRYKNYCSDITRMVSVGTPTSEISHAYDTLYKAQQQAIFNLEGSKTYTEVDQICRDSLSNAGYPVFSHATGHGIGIQVHEPPHFSPISPDTIKPGHVITVEPGIYIPEKWGMRLEDTVLINNDGSATTLTNCKRHLIII